MSLKLEKTVELVSSKLASVEDIFTFVESQNSAMTGKFDAVERQNSSETASKLDAILKLVPTQP
jgi:hypothetical protein